VGKGWARTGFGESLAPAASALCPGARWPEKESPPDGAAMTGRSTPLARRDPPSRPCCRKPPSNFAESASHVPPPGLSLLSGVSGEPSIPQQGNSAEHPPRNPPRGCSGSSPDVNHLRIIIHPLFIDCPLPICILSAMRVTTRTVNVITDHNVRLCTVSVITVTTVTTVAPYVNFGPIGYIIIH